MRPHHRDAPTAKVQRAGKCTRHCNRRLHTAASQMPHLSGWRGTVRHSTDLRNYLHNSCSAAGCPHASCATSPYPLATHLDSCGPYIRGDILYYPGADARSYGSCRAELYHRPNRRVRNPFLAASPPNPPYKVAAPLPRSGRGASCIYDFGAMSATPILQNANQRHFEVLVIGVSILINVTCHKTLDGITVKIRWRCYQ
jgi:hypothetical protein